MRTQRKLAASLVAAVCLLGAGVTVAPTAGAAEGTPKAVFAKAGPYKVGVQTLTIGDRKAEVWYPTTRKAVRGKTKDAYNIAKYLPQALQDLLTKAKIDAPFTTDAYRGVKPVAKHRFPLVLFSHGFSGYREQSTFLTTHIASWGFVVSSPDFLERGLTAQLGNPPAVTRTDDDILNATVKATRAAFPKLVKKGKVAIVGHSAGGFTAINYADQPNVLTYIPLSSGPFATQGGAAPTPPKKPSMYITGRQDGIAEFDRVKGAYATVPAPKRFVVIDGSGHLNGMSDICEIGKGGGGVVALAEEAGIPVPANLKRLGTDGCFPPALPSKQVWKVTRHFVVAQLRWEFRLEDKPVGLQPSVVKAFLPVKVTYTQTIKP
jgi:dienelactone hydrolase